jgi:acylphosphatase
MKSLQKIHLVIYGRVQGVGFRYHTSDTARRLGLVGWVRNLPEGTVETYAEGDEATIQKFEDWCKHGPPLSQVERISRLEKGPIVALTFQAFNITR